MKQITAILFFSFYCSLVFAQNSGTLKGKLIDTIGKQTLKNATISILDPQDSTLEIFGLAKDDGSFEIKNISFGTFLIHISFESYTSYFKTITFSKTKPDINMGFVFMKQAANLLPDVVVTQSPIVMKKDTIEYNAGSFKTKPNAVVEDLLKKLPGMEVDKNGGVKAQGETVQRVLVDGKRFFGDDPQMATKNLPPDVVDKIQVFDDLSDQSKFTGFDDGNHIKTINITTKKDKRKGYFGKAVAGAGTDGKYDENFNMHRFNGNQQISLLGQANNVNKQNFSSQNIFGGGNRGGNSSSGTGSGITKTISGGANYRDQWGINTQVSGSYFYNNQNTNTLQTSRTENPLTADSSTYSDKGQNSTRNNGNHRINFNLEQQFDTSNSLVFRPNISFQNTNSNTYQTTVFTGGKSFTPIYNTATTSSQENNGLSGSADLLFRHKFKKLHRTYSLAFNVSDNTNNGNGDNFSAKHYFNPVTFDTLDQHIITSSTGYTLSPTFSYTEPLARNQILEFNYNYTYTNSTSNRSTYSFNPLTHQHDLFDSLFSNDYINNYNSNRFTLSYRLQNLKYNFNISSGLQTGERTSINTTKNITTAQNFVNITPTANFMYNFSKTKSLRFFYSGRTGQPSVSQLQPLATTSDSINFSKGNPDLKQQFTHSVRLLYNNFNVATQRVIMVTINASMISNDIQNSITYLPTPPNKKGSTLTVPVNLNGTYSVSGYFNYGFPLKKPKSNLNFTTNIGYNQSQTLVNNYDANLNMITTNNYTRNTSLSETIRWTTNLKDNFDMNFSSTSSYNIARNTMQPTQNANYLSQSLSAEITYYTKNGWIAASDFDYTYTQNGSSNSGYNSSVPLWNPSIAKQFFKNKAGELRLTCFDLLNQNVSVKRSISQSGAITDTRSNVLTRYLMLTFTYNLRRFAGTQQRMPSFMGGKNRNNGNFGGNGGGGFRSGGGGRRG
jgi:hypothetical protein